MADYGVPEELDGTLPWSWAEQRMAASRNFWLVTVNAAGRPHSMPVWGVWMPERERFGFSCAKSARKVRNIAANPRVVVTNDDAVHVVSIEGRAVDLEPDGELTLAEGYLHKYADEPGFADGGVDAMIEFLRANATYEVIPERAFGMIETPEEFGAAATRWTWDQP